MFQYPLRLKIFSIIASYFSIGDAAILVPGASAVHRYPSFTFFKKKSTASLMKKNKKITRAIFLQL
jgi:hypothetical protein